MKLPNPRWVELFISLVFCLLLFCPELAHQRTWWWALMKGSREGARRCGQVAILAENRYRAEVEI